MLTRVDAILWRKCNQATFDSLIGHSKGQYHIGLSKGDFESFFIGLSQSSVTDLDGYDLVVPIQEFTGPQPVPEANITVRFMGPKSARRDWNIPSQRPGTAYTLWQPGRGMGTTFSAGAHEYVLIVRDLDGNFHARWVNSTDFDALPMVVQEIMRSKEVGWRSLV